ncbi:MAG: hypothetical protein ACXACX_16490 [Candidatus Hodarchaeales archaeon]|jgi:hypothetical protein
MSNETETSVETMMKKCLETFFPNESTQKDMMQFMENCFDSSNKENIENMCNICPCADLSPKTE